MLDNRLISIATIASMLVVGCEQKKSAPTINTERAVESRDGAADNILLIESVEELSEHQQEQHRVALAAREALFTRLSGRLMSAIEKDGPAASVEICRSQAPAIAEQVKREFGVNIGRTSFRLRNSMNPPPDWARGFVADRVDSPKFITLPDDTLGVLLPIRLQTKCVLCHGPKDQIADDVQAALNLHYPNDEATGFQEGDLRGWFWVEAPDVVRTPTGDTIE